MVIFWALMMIILLVYVQYIVFHKLVLKKVHYERKFKQRTVFEEETVYLEEKIENRKRLLIPWLYVESMINVNLSFGKQENLFVSTGSLYQNHASFFMLRGYQRVIRTHYLKPKKRGFYHLQTVSLKSGDLLGFSQRVISYQMTDNEPLLVYPKPVVPTITIANRDLSLGDVIVKRLIMPDPFMKVGTRPYVPGDAIKAINWKATARTNELQINQFDYTSNKRLMVLINCEDHEKMWKTVNNVDMVENYIRYTSGLTERALREGMEAGYATNMCSHLSEQSTIVLPQGGQAYWYTILESLAHLKVERTIPFNELLEQFLVYSSEPIEFVVFSSYWSDQLEHIAELLRHKSHQVYHIELNQDNNPTSIDHIKEAL